jgi:hypothetical protein
MTGNAWLASGAIMAEPDADAGREHRRRPTKSDAALARNATSAAAPTRGRQPASHDASPS